MDNESVGAQTSGGEWGDLLSYLSKGMLTRERIESESQNEDNRLAAGNVNKVEDLGSTGPGEWATVGNKTSIQ